MPSLSNHHSAKTVKGLLLGDSGTGKTASLASLARDGYNLMIFDFDNGLDIVASLLSDDPDAQNRVWFKTFTDAWQPNQAGKMIPSGRPKAWKQGISALKSWKEQDDEGNEQDLGGMYDWGPDTVLVIDSLSFASKAAMNFHLHNVGRLGDQPQIQDWGEGQRLVNGLLNALYSADVQCNVICTAHIRYVGEDDETTPTRGFAETLGKALPPEVNKFFNTVLMSKIQGSGSKARRVIRTVPDSFVGLKNTAPKNLEAELDLETALSKVFQAIRNK